MSDMYWIICLKRSKFLDTNEFDYITDWFNHSHIVYWKPDRAGYTYKKEEAGQYATSDLFHCCGDGVDWFLMRIPPEEVQ